MAAVESPLLIAAGEASADVHAAEVLRALHATRPHLRAFGIGGAHLRAAGLEAIVDSEDMGVAGLTEVLGALPRLWGYLKRVEQQARWRRPKVALLLDMPDFNLRLAKRLKALGIRVVYYISPQVWAWRERRVETIRKQVDDMLVILPFEEAFYRARGVPARFVGHPSVGQVFGGQQAPSAEAARLALGLPAAPKRLVALLPGSRRQELRRHLPTMLDTLALLRREAGGAAGVIPIASSLPRDEVERLVAQAQAKNAPAGGAPLEVFLIDGRAHEVLAATDAAIVCSGTATLEAALIGRPMVVVYRVSLITYAILRLLVRVAHVALVNLIARREVVPELLQRAMRPQRIAKVVQGLLDSEPARARMRRELFAIRRQLSEKPAAEVVAQTLLGHLDAVGSGAASPAPA